MNIIICFLSGMAGMATMFMVICFIPEINDLINSITKLFKNK